VQPYLSGILNDASGIGVANKATYTCSDGKFFNKYGGRTNTKSSVQVWLSVLHLTQAHASTAQSFSTKSFIRHYTLLSLPHFHYCPLDSCRLCYGDLEPLVAAAICSALSSSECTCRVAVSNMPNVASNVNGALSAMYHMGKPRFLLE